jgi:hypothetical protein
MSISRMLLQLFPHAIVMLLYLFCLGTNGEEGLEVGQHSVLALPLAESLPNGVEARWLLLPGPSDPLGSRAELGGLLSLLGLWRKQAPDHGNVPAVGHRPCVSDLGGNLMISTCRVVTISPFNPSLACSPLAKNKSCGGQVAGEK